MSTPDTCTEMASIATIRCPGCDWEFPISYNRGTCRWCGAVLPEGRCHKCQLIRPLVDGVYCAECNKALTIVEEYARHLDLQRIQSNDLLSAKAPMNAYYNKREANEVIHLHWITAVDRVPKEYHTLTESEWSNAISYFRVCATCGAPEISTRGMFIPFQDNGQYCDWNVIPICSNCAGKKHHINPFIWLSSTSSNYEDPKACLERIKQYLYPRLKEATTWKDFQLEL